MIVRDTVMAVLLLVAGILFELWAPQLAKLHAAATPDEWDRPRMERGAYLMYRLGGIPVLGFGAYWLWVLIASTN